LIEMKMSGKAKPCRTFSFLAVGSSSQKVEKLSSSL